jgi:T-complex protein 1 subunit delta
MANDSGFQKALDTSLDVIKNNLSIPVEISNRETLIQCVNTSLSSKVVSANSELLSPMAVDAVLRDIKIVKKLGGIIDDTTLVEGIVFDKCKPSSASGGPTKIVDAKIAVVQFQIATPKTDL